MNVLDLKIKEVKAVDKQILKLRPGYKQKIKKIKSKTRELKKALKKEKRIIKRVMKKIEKHQRKLVVFKL